MVLLKNALIGMHTSRSFSSLLTYLLTCPPTQRRKGAVCRVKKGMSIVCVTSQRPWDERVCIEKNSRIFLELYIQVQESIRRTFKRSE